MIKPLPSMILDFHIRKDNPAFLYKDEDQWTEIFWDDYQNDVFKLAQYLLNLGLKKDAKISIFSNTRYEWCVCDLAIMCIQGVSVPIYQNSTPEEIKTIIHHSESELIILENAHSLKTWNKIKDQCPGVKNIIILEQGSIADREMTSIEKIFSSNLKAENIKALKKAIQSIQLSDVATIVYTSGTTGLPKGVLLSHEQIISEVSEAFPTCGLTQKDRSLTFLPFAHVFGRIENWAHCYFGYTMAFAEGIDKIKKNLVEINPTFIFAVPRIFEKIYTYVVANLENNKYFAEAFHWALNAGKTVHSNKNNGRLSSLIEIAKYEIAKKLILNKIKMNFGNQLRFCVSGGAPLNSTISEFFEACGVLLLEGYGLTETTAAVCVNTPFNYRFGSVGTPIGDVQLKIADDGEVLVKSKKVMLGYYKNPEATKEVMEDGWFKTGDIGEILSNGALKITDRKKDLIKTANGKYVAPQKLEGLLKLNPLISHALIHGDQKKYIVALITLEKGSVLKWAKDNSIAESNWEKIIKSQSLVDYVRKSIININSELANHETIKKYLVLNDEFTVENGALTPSLKVKRKLLDQRYQAQIESLY